MSILVSIFVCINRIFRRENNQSSNVHCFTVFFCVKLVNDGFDGVAHFTGKSGKRSKANRIIDVFSKKLVFLPYVKDQHYSLTIIVNPGKIENYYKAHTKDTELPL